MNTTFNRSYRIFFGSYDPKSTHSWIYIFNFEDLSAWELYVTSFYFTVTTIMTVGYGDITAKTMPEKLLCILLMLLGVIAFSYATGSISSIITNQDSTEAKLRVKMMTLESIQHEYNIDEKLFNKIVKIVKYDHH